MNRADLRDLLRRRIRDLNESHFSDSYLNTWLNQAASHVQSFLTAIDPHAIQKSAIGDIVDGESIIALPSEIISLFFVEVADEGSDSGWRLIDRRDMDVVKAERAARSNAAMVYSETGMAIHLDPIPSATVTDGIRVTYSYWWQFTDDTASPPFPLPLHQCIAVWAHRILAPQVADGPTGTQLQDEFDAVISNLPLYHFHAAGKPPALRPAINKGYGFSRRAQNDLDPGR